MGLFDVVKSWLGIQYTIPVRSRRRRGKKKTTKKKTGKKKSSSKKTAKPADRRTPLKKKRSVKKTAKKPAGKTKKVKKKTAKKVKKTPPKNSKPKPKSKTAKKTLRRKKSVSGVKGSLKRKKEKNEREVGIVTHYFPKISVGIIKLSGALRVGRTIRFKGAHDDFIQTVESMQVNHRDVTIVGRGAEAGLKVTQRVHQGDKVYLVEA